jgi:anti-anti-sigma factor
VPNSYIPQPWCCQATRDADGVTRIVLTGELDMAVAPEFGAELSRALADSTSVIVDLGQLVFMDSSGLHLLATAAAHARHSGGWLAIVHPAPNVRRVLDLTGMSEVLEIIDGNRLVTS